MKRNSSLYEFDALINTTPLAVVITDGEGIIEVVNAKAEVMFGYESRELLGKTIEVLMPEGLRENHLKHRADYIAKPFTRLMGIGVDLIGRRKGGEEFPAEIGLNYHQNGDGIQVISYITDITMRKQVEQDRINLIETEKASMEQELHMAHQVQLDLLPGEIPKIPGWSFAVKWLPAGEVAGDFYDFIVRNHTDVDLVIADVIDKGMPAALFMVFAHTALRAYIDSGFSLIDGITRTNRLMCQESSQGLFVTLFLTCLNPRLVRLFMSTLDIIHPYITNTNLIDLPVYIRQEWLLVSMLRQPMKNVLCNSSLVTLYCFTQMGSLRLLMPVDKILARNACSK